MQQFEHKYTSAVIAWAPEDQPSDTEIDRVLDEFEDTAWPGLSPDRYAWTAVRHREAGRGVHVHVVAARCDLETGKSLNIAPPGWEQMIARPGDAQAVETGHDAAQPVVRPGRHQPHAVDGWFRAERQGDADRRDRCMP